MEYKLEQLDKLVTTATDTSQAANLNLSANDSIRILREIFDEVEKIKSLLVQQVFSFTKEKEIEVYIKNYQIGCTHLLDRLYQQENTTVSKNENAQLIFKDFFTLILSLLSFIEERFSKYFDRMEKVPDVYLVLTKQEIRNHQATVKNHIEKGIDESTLLKVEERLELFLNTPSPNVVSYRDIMFYKELVKELEDVKTWEMQSNVFSGLEQLLIYLNYNSKEFVNELINKIAKELQSLTDLNEKIDRLLLYGKTLNQLQIKPDSSLLARHPSVKTQLSNWFSEELSYLEHMLHGLLLKQKSDSTPMNKSKVLCKVSVDQLSIFFRAASDLQLIGANSQKALFEQLAPWISTSHRTLLSADSMRSKSYSPEKKEIEAVKDLLMQLFRQIGKY